MKEKKRLVYDLYCKKLMFKCFAGWANIAMTVSDEELSSEGDDYDMNEVAHISCNDQYV